MPELPEVERVARTIAARIIGRRVTAVRLRRRDICESFRGGRRVRTTERDLLQGACITAVRRRGKQMAIVAEDGRSLCVHLGMTGQLTWRAATPGREALHVHTVWRLADAGGREAGEMVFRDPRRFGGLWTFDTMGELEAARWGELGPDALAIRAEDLLPRLKQTDRAVKAALLDQSLLAGVGNIYADEALFRARLDPRRKGARFTPDEVERLAKAIRDVLAAAIEAGGSTLRDFRDADSAPGSYQKAHDVYGRGGMPCRVCGTRLRSIRLAQRATVFCSVCQRSGRSRQRQEAHAVV